MENGFISKANGYELVVPKLRGKPVIANKVEYCVGVILRYANILKLNQY